jgi:ubiquinol-cytochrome c reductase cytochrome c1 subunit
LEFLGLVRGLQSAQLQRGFKVYHDVCGNCHTLKIPFRTLADPHGPAFSEPQVTALGASSEVANDTPNDKGEIFKRPGRLSDFIPPPAAYLNPAVAAATFGKAPPDMSLLAKALKFERGFPWFVFDALPSYNISRRRLHLCDSQRLYEERRSWMEPLFPGP